MSTLETRAIHNGKPIDNQWIRENEANEFYYQKDNSEPNDFHELEEAAAILKAIQALKTEELEELKMVREELKKVDQENENSGTYYFDGEFLFESEEEHEKELERIMG